MSASVDRIWIAANHSFQRFDNKLLHYLSQDKSVARWEYYQHQDEPSSYPIALGFLSNYLDTLDCPIDLIGHSTGGLLGLLYARKYPEKVKSLTLLGVGCNPAIDWQAHYYAMRGFLPCSDRIILAQMVHKIFGTQNQYNTKGLSRVLQQDLKTSPSPHSLFRRVKVNNCQIVPPLLVCGSSNDAIVDRNSLQGWQKYLKPEDKVWQCHQGNHFFYYFYPQEVSQQVLDFWQRKPPILQLQNRKTDLSVR